MIFYLDYPVLINWLQAVYDAFFISTYNVFYTSMPVIVMGIFDQDVDDTASLRYGSLFSSGMNNELFNRKLFAMEAIKGLLSSLILSGFAAGNLKFITLLLTVWKFLKFFCQNWDSDFRAFWTVQNGFFFLNLEFTIFTKNQNGRKIHEFLYCSAVLVLDVLHSVSRHTKRIAHLSF